MNPYRSYLFVPAHKQGWPRKGAAAGADALILDLEDAVPKESKSEARQMLVTSIAEAREVRPQIGIVVRVNHLSSAEASSDYDAVVGTDADAIMVPKVEAAEELRRLDAFLEYAEERTARIRPLEIVATLETARGVAGGNAIAGAPRVGALLVSTTKDGDIARSIGFNWTEEGLETLYLRSAAVIAARATTGCLPIVGVWQDIANLDGLERRARMNRDLGFSGEALIHPSHIDVINRVYSPDSARLEYYRGLIAAYETALENGRGAVVYQGEHIDLAHVTTARQFVAFAEQIVDLG